MTLFGKIIFGGLVVIVGGTLAYGFTMYLREDSNSAQNSVVESEVKEQPSENPTSTSTVQSSTTVAVVTPTSVTDGKKIPFSDFMKKGGSYKCTVTQTMAGMTTRGIVYINNLLIRANFTISVSGQNIETTMIAKDGYTYSWTSANKGMGVKAKMNTANGNGNAPASATYTWDGSQIGEYSCESWAVDNSLFTIPTDVTFTEAR